MQHTPIPGTDLEPAAICLGTVKLGSALDRDASFTLLDAYLELGGNLIDTASLYADWLTPIKSVSEKTIGQWFKARGNRDRVLLATKGGHYPYTGSSRPPSKVARLARDELESDLEASLRNLQTEVIDLYWLHRDDPRRPVSEILEVLNDQVRAGKIRYYGCSNWRAPRIREAQDYAEAQGLSSFVADQMMWSLAEVDPNDMADETMVAMDEGLGDYHMESGLAAIPYSSQAGGYFQKLARARGRRARAKLAPLYHTAENQARFERVRQLAADTGLSITQIVLGYLMSQPFPTVPIVGCHTVAQLKDSMSAGDVKLDAAQIAYLEHGARELS